MAKRASESTKDYLMNAPLPAQTDTYTVISHSFVMDKTEEMLSQHGFPVGTRLYKCNTNAQIAQGIYRLNYGSDPELSMLVSWSNSYDKSMRFKFAVGACVNESGNVILPAKIGAWDRKHTGAADEETSKTIASQIASADVYYNQLVEDKAEMKLISLTLKDKAELVGRLYLEKQTINSDQLAVIKSELKKPSYDYETGPDSLWAFYNYITYSLQKAHPKTWMDQQRLTHWFLCEQFNINPLSKGLTSENSSQEIVNIIKGDVNPNQLDIVTESEKAEEALVNDAPSIEIEPETIVEFERRSQLAAQNETFSNSNLSKSDVQILEDGPQIAVQEEETLWNCLNCGEPQGTNAVFYEGQLCQKCYVKE